jgi:hypothetical protein
MSTKWLILAMTAVGVLASRPANASPPAPGTGGCQSEAEIHDSVERVMSAMELRPANLDPKLRAQVREMAVGLCRADAARKAAQLAFEKALAAYLDEHAKAGRSSRELRAVERAVKRSFSSCAELRERSNAFHVPRNLIMNQANLRICYDAAATMLKEPDDVNTVNGYLPPQAPF